MFNNCNLVGRMGEKIDYKKVSDDVAVCNFSMAVVRPSRDKEGNEIVDWFDVTVWRKLADIVNSYGAKGRLIVVRGRFECDTYTNQNGEKRKAWKLNADDVRFLDSPKQNEQKAATGTDDISSVTLDDLPF